MVSINLFQLFNILLALLKILFLLALAYQLVCHRKKSAGMIACTAIVLMMLVPIVLIYGILRQNLQLVRFCKLYSMVEKGLVICVQVIVSLKVPDAMEEEFRTFGINFMCILLIVAYMFVRNWLYNGVIESIQSEIAEKYEVEFNLIFNEGYL